MLRREKVSKSCDVYSYAVLLFEIATQQQPFPDVNPLLVPAMIVEGKVSNSEGTIHFTECPYTILVCMQTFGSSITLWKATKSLFVWPYLVSTRACQLSQHTYCNNYSPVIGKKIWLHRCDCHCVLTKMCKYCGVSHLGVSFSPPICHYCTLWTVVVGMYLTQSLWGCLKQCHDCRHQPTLLCHSL